jgi:hypothetical protein
MGQICWVCREPPPAPSPSPEPVPGEAEAAAPPSEPQCADYVTEERIGSGEWLEYGIAGKIERNEFSRHLGGISDSIACFYGRRIDEAFVFSDELYYGFDIQSGALLRRRIHWHEDLPEHLPPFRISRQEAEAMVEGEVSYSALTYISPGAELALAGWLDRARLCWRVWSKEPGMDGTTWITVIDAQTGEVFGHYCPC